jgi:predicted RecB family nuclease
MNSDTPVTDTAFEALLHCDTKSYLLHESIDNQSKFGVWGDSLGQQFKQGVSEWLRSSFGDEVYVGTPSRRMLKQGSHRIVLRPLIKSSDLCAEPDALWRTPPDLERHDFRYGPVRFIRNEKVSRFDKLLLAFDALALNRFSNNPLGSGKLIYGSQYRILTVPLAKFLEKARHSVVQLTKQQKSGVPPPLVLNKHCPECVFCARCRQAAVEKDDLSLLANMTAKERQKLNDKGIFTVTQLSYTFRPRRRRRFKGSQTFKHEPSLKALAIRKDLIHVVGTSTFNIPEGAVYVDVEGIPDRDFYYLIGLRYKTRDEYVQRSFWADSPSDERQMWASCFSVLKLLHNPRLFHYGNYETLFLKRMKVRYLGQSGDEGFLDQLIASSVNLLSLIYAQVYFPTYSNGLKDVARRLGFEWSESEASGRQALIWRAQWETNRNPTLKRRLIDYNQEDCQAMQRVAEAIANVCSERPSTAAEAMSVNVSMLERDPPLRFGPLQYVAPDFKAINEAAYWDYQRNKVYVRTNDRLKRISRKRVKNITTSGLPVNKSIQAKENRPSLCPKCNSTKFYRNGRFNSVTYDLRFSPAGVRRWVVRHNFNRYQCRNCKNGYNELPRQELFGAHLKAYVLYQIIELRVSQHAIGRSLGVLFGLQMSPTSVNCIKISATKQYEPTYRGILHRIIEGPLVHADETRVMINGEAHYVWVFTNLEDVAYVYSNSRDASTALEVLTGFKGVLVSDFYAGYDSVDCAQQRCLIHLLRDINEDVLKEPFNVELEELAHGFASLLRPMVATIDRFGLKTYHLRRHKLAVERFYRALSGRDYKTDVAAGYKKRFEKNRDKLFTFLDHDGVPWNNNNAEHAIKAFARLRKVIGANGTPKGVRQYLVLLSISETCKYKGISFLDFLRSGEIDLDAFAAAHDRQRKLLAKPGDRLRVAPLATPIE